MPHTVQIALPLPLDTLFSYAAPHAVPAGVRVRVPFGSRQMVGVVVGSDGGDAPDELRPVTEILDPQPVLDRDLMDLTAWIAEYYACSLGEALRAALPPLAPPRAVRFAALAGAGSVTPRGARQRAIVEVLVGAAASGQDDMPVPDLLRAAEASHATLASLERLGAIRLFDRNVSREVVPEPDAQPAITRERFGPEQVVAAEALEQALSADRFHAFLLHGITGSGKTEVYIDALRQARARGRSGIVLVPEIALTPQTVARFRRHFGQEVAVLHSRMGDGERADTWHRVCAGDARIVIGPRSAVFAPVRDLGLIVVDEEHEASYKQFEPAPRYHARDVALVRAQRAGAVCVLGSATPSLESFHNAKTGKYTLLRLTDRVPLPDGQAARLPDVRVVDLFGERTESGELPILSAALRRAITDRLAHRQQVILLQNRRGYAPVLQCTACGEVPECPDCSVSLTYHKATRQARCHYCGRAFRHDVRCGSCGEPTLGPQGAGTQRVEEALAEAFPDARVLRMDLDTTHGRDAHDRILEAFGSGQADILVGTQMVAKGLDFERVTLVGVIDADAGLLFPDFRADERTFQLLTQVAGRAGRAELLGEVIFQTRNSRHPVIRLARRHDYEQFAAAALAERQALGYPPFGRAVRVEFRGPSEGAVRTLSARWSGAFARHATGADVVGPAPAFISRVRKSYRYQALVKAPRSLPTARLRAALASAVEEVGRLPRGCRINVDVDPMGVL